MKDSLIPFGKAERNRNRFEGSTFGGGFSMK